jgi:hypothetical protein
MASFYLVIFMKQNAGTFREAESLCSKITRKVAILQVKIIPTVGGKDK